MAAITRLQFDVTCYRCGGGLTIVNPGGTCGTESKTIVACEPCGREWAITVLMRDLTGPFIGKHTARRATPQRLADGASEARRLVDSGISISEACRRAGISRHAYYDRLPAAVG